MTTSDEAGRQETPSRNVVIRWVWGLVRIKMTDGIPQGRTDATATESDLIARYMLPRGIVRDALHLLAEEGMIERRRAQGPAQSATARR